MGHLSIDNLKKLRTMSDGLDFKESSMEECELCLKGRMKSDPFPEGSERASEVLEIIHSDVCGPTEPRSHGRAEYFVGFTDNKSRY
jgi:hypothetical protein